ncbi:MAG: DUF4430 domain-containing protein, partial [Clostridiales bacterium]|nr:DUF4430 domain-containing protein [Clostridiales bacterium]
NVGTLAKTALGLAAVGIDARQIPDPDSGAPIDLLEEIGTWTGVVHPLYAAPYVLSLYDLGPYDAPRDAVLTREGLLASILEAQDAVTGLWETADGTGMVLAALAPYYQASDGVYGVSAGRCAEITAAVDDALAALSAMQTMDGGFGGRNASTTATVLTALNALGIDVQTDPRFDKGGATPLTNLLSFRTAGDQLGYTDVETPNAMASYQGFQALATYQNLTAGTRSRSLYQFPAQVDVYLSWPDAKLLTAIAITAGPTVTDYTYDASQTAFAVDTDGLAVTAVYNGDPSNTTPVDLSDCTISPINRASPGTRQVTVSYQGKTDIFFVTVLEEDNSVPAQDRASVKVRGLRGVIAEGSAVIEAGVTTALDALKSVLTAAGTPAVIQGGAYVVSIDGLGEFDEGENSGWMYAVNGVTPSDTAANQYRLYAGDQVVWYYVTDYTSDSGGADGPKEEEPPEEPVSFADVSERDWFCQAVFFVADRGLFRGVSETAFAPHDSMDRGMMVTVLWRLAGAPQAGTAAAPLFPDVSEDSYYSEAVEWAVSEHILAGYQTGLFGGGDRVTREQIAVFLFRYAGQRGYDTGASAELTGYGDAGEVSAFAREAVGWANALGLMTGRAPDRLAPKDEATRAEVAEVLRRFVTYYAVP